MPRTLTHDPSNPKLKTLNEGLAPAKHVRLVPVHGRHYCGVRLHDQGNPPGGSA